MLRRIISIIAGVSLLCGITTPALAASTFRDVPSGHWAYSYVSEAAEKGWVNGTDNGIFSPDKAVSGAEFVTMIVRAYYADDIQPAQSSIWYEPYINAGNANYILDGAHWGGATLGAWANPAKRYQMAIILYNIIRQSDIPVDQSAVEAAKQQITDYSDMATTPDWRESVPTCYALGLLNGYEDGSFGGQNTMTRAEAATVMCRLDDILSSVSSDPVSPSNPNIDDDNREQPSVPEITTPDQEVVPGYVDIQPNGSGYSLTYIPSTGIWNGQREDRIFGFNVNSIADVRSSLDSVMDYYPKAVYFFSENKLDFSPRDLLEQYELSHGLISRVKGTCYDYFNVVPQSIG